MKNFIIFSLVYIFIFSGYYLTTSFLNILYPNQAFLSFAVFSSVYSLGSLFAPFIVSRINIKITLFVSCLCFGIFIGFSGSAILSLLLIGSAIGGFGNSLIWLVQGTFLDVEQLGLFYTLYNINIILGNIFGLIVLLTGLSVQIMILSILGLTGIGCILSFFVKPKMNGVKKIELREILKIFLVFKKCYWLIPCYLYQAIGLNITFQIIPRLLIATTDETLQIKSIYNAVIFIVYGIFAMGFSFIWGKLFMKNWKFVVIPYSILEIICLISILMLAIYNRYPGLWIIIGALRGCIDYGINNTINITLSKEEEDVSNLYGFYRFIYAIAYLLSSICIGYIPYQYVLLICLIFLLFSTISYILKKRMEIEEQFNNSKIVISSIV